MIDAEKVTDVPSRNARVKHRRTRRPSLGNDEFLRKALDVFYEKGFAGTSIDAITAAAGIGKKTIYDRYGDKETLFKVAIERAIDDWNVPVERLWQAETDRLEDSLLAIGQILVDNILKPAGLRLLRLTNAESVRMPSIGEHNVHYGQDPIIAYLADLFLRRLPANGGTFEEATDAAEAFLHLVVGGPANAAAWGVVKDKEEIDRRTRFSIRIFVRGLLTVSGNGVPGGAVEKARAEMADAKTMLAQATQSLDRASRRLAGGTAEDD